MTCLYSVFSNHFEAQQMYQNIFNKRKVILVKDHPVTLKSKAHVAYSIHTTILEVRPRHCNHIKKFLIKQL